MSFPHSGIMHRCISGAAILMNDEGALHIFEFIHVVGLAIDVA
jgi:hypothetical protein